MRDLQRYAVPSSLVVRLHYAPRGSSRSRSKSWQRRNSRTGFSYSRSFFSGRGTTRWPIVLRINAGVVHLAINRDPIGAVDPALVGRGWAFWVCARHFDPTVLLRGNDANLVGDLRQILVLTKHNGHVVLSAMRHSNDVQRNSDVDALFLSDGDRVLGAVRKAYSFVPVSQRARKNRTPRWPIAPILEVQK
jgi:hypothetical protein